MKNTRCGLVHIYTGNGKGKTTAAFGLALRALGCGLRVLCIQFLKGAAEESGEIKCLRNIKGIKFIRNKQVHPVFWNIGIRHDKKLYNKELQKLRLRLTKSIKDAKRLIKSKRYDLVILDEIINTASSGLIDERLIAGLIRSKPKNTEIVLTGRGTAAKLIELADYATVMRELKHPYRRGIKARKGIEE
ncbi:MAG: cob(I)yrinic acid a,c-diamide adenosyltransferase [Candidatus Omnitrophota bacterium]